MNKKTVGIITIHKSNFGGCLQSYALWAYIKSIGYKCEIIDLYRPVMTEYKNETTSLSFSTCIQNERIKNLKHFVKIIITFITKKTKPQKGIYNFTNNDNFKSFNALIKYSQPYRSIDSLYQNPPDYDIYISGSDQIWNPDMPFENEPYLLSFVPKKKKCISYASSFGRNNLPEKFTKHYQNCLKRYSSISVREETGQFIVKKLIGKEPIVALDPTMLFGKDYWQTISIHPKIKPKYLFCFSLKNDSELVNFASEICKKKGLALVIISDKIYTYKGVQIINKPDSGPKEWLGLIENAELIVTDSFHGTVFSAIFEKTFLSYIKYDNSKTNSGTRIENLVSQLSLEPYLIHNLNSINNTKLDIIDYSDVNEKIEILRDLSKDYLHNSLT